MKLIKLFEEFAISESLDRNDTSSLKRDPSGKPVEFLKWEEVDPARKNSDMIGNPTVNGVSLGSKEPWVVGIDGRPVRIAGKKELEDYRQDVFNLGWDEIYNSKKTTPTGQGTNPLLTKLQMRLKALGGEYAKALGTSGPSKDGVDGKFGKATLAAVNLALDKLGAAKAPDNLNPVKPKEQPAKPAEPANLNIQQPFGDANGLPSEFGSLT